MLTKIKLKKIVLAMLLSVLGTAVYAQTDAPMSESNMVLLVTGIAALLIMVGLLMFIIAYQLYSVLEKIAPKPKREIQALGSGNPIKEVQALFSGVVNNRLMDDHIYDGDIQEMDNGMPPWLAYFFYGTVAFGIVYLLNYHFLGTSDLQDREYEVEMAEAKIRYGENANTPKIAIIQLTAADKIAAGKEAYIKNCVACHGKLGEGGVGPNLTDDYWVHGGKVESIFKVIREGVAQKGMIAWKANFKDEQILELTSYVMTLKGTNPPNAKEPQGNKE